MSMTNMRGSIDPQALILTIMPIYSAKITLPVILTQLIINLSNTWPKQIMHSSPRMQVNLSHFVSTVVGMNSICLLNSNSKCKLMLLLRIQQMTGSLMILAAASQH